MIKYFVIRNFRGTSTSVKMLKGYVVICRNAEGVHGQRKVGNPWSSSMRSFAAGTPVGLLEQLQVVNRTFLSPFETRMIAAKTIQVVAEFIQMGKALWIDVIRTIAELWLLAVSKPKHS